MYVCRSKFIAEATGSSDLLALPDSGTGKGVPVQPLPHPQTTHRDRTRALPHRAADQDLVPEPPDEVQEGDPAHQRAERDVLWWRRWPARTSRPQGAPRTCPLGRFIHRRRPGKQDSANTLASSSFTVRSLVDCFIAVRRYIARYMSVRLSPAGVVSKQLNQPSANQYGIVA